MTDHLENYLREPAPAIVDDHGKLQRNALQEVLRMTPDAIQSALLQVKSAHQENREDAKAKYLRVRRKIASQYEDQAEEARQAYQTARKQIEAEYETDINNLEVETKHKQDRAVSNAEAEVQEAEKNYEYEMMLAENVAEAMEKKCKQDRRNIKEAVPAAKHRLDELQGQAEGIMSLYRQTLPPEQVIEAPEPVGADEIISVFRKQHESAQQYLNTLYALQAPRLFIGIRPILYALLICGGAVGLMGALSFQDVVNLPAFYATGPAALIVSLVLVWLVGRWKWRSAKSQVKEVIEPFQQIIVEAHLLLDRSLTSTLEKIDQLEEKTVLTRAEDEEKAEKKYKEAKIESTQRRERILKETDDAYQQTRRELEEHLERARQSIEAQLQRLIPQLEQEKNEALNKIQQQYENETKSTQKIYDIDISKLHERWRRGWNTIATLLKDTNGLDDTLSRDWNDSSWRRWEPRNTFAAVARFGSIRLAMDQLAPEVKKLAPFKIDSGEPVILPALLSFPDRCSLLIQTEREGREQAINALRSIMMRLFTTLPPGRVHFTIVDPIGLGENFAGFMHAADYKEALIGGRIWTDAAQIQQQLDDLTGHMENVIQKYLRNEFETIEEYNRQAGELAEPYRFLVIADFPTNFNEESGRRLSSIINSGARCGVYTLIMYDVRRELPPNLDIEDISQKSVYLIYKDGRFEWQDKVFREFPLQLDTPPIEDVLTDIMHRVGRAAKESSRVEVPFDIVAPAEEQYWSLDSSEEISVPIGRTGATRLQHLRLGRGVAQHMLIAGKTGSGKSTLLHVIITNLALWYAPDQVEVYLIDFKKGVEFKTYVSHKLIHARAIAVESDREFGLSVLQRLDAELTRRGELFRQAGVQDIASYREATGAVLPRTVLIVDEFQVFFAEDDKLAQDAAIILEQLVRQGRAFGLHVLLGSQTLGGTANLARSTLGQMAIRIALQCSETDSQLILDDDNVAARLLSRPGEAIYNDAGGMVVGNSPYQTAWLPDAVRDEYLARISERAEQRPTPAETQIVFEGNVPADITSNQKLAECLEQASQVSTDQARQIWLGEPVAIKDPTAAVFRRQSGANLLVVGQREMSALGVMSAAMVSVAAQETSNEVELIILDGSPPDSATGGFLDFVSSQLPLNRTVVEWRDVPEVIAGLAAKIQQRLQEDSLKAPAIFLFVFGLQRYRVLRRSEDDFSFSLEEQIQLKPDRQFAEILREGPPVGIHTIIWSDTLVAVERTLDRQTVREFDNRVLFQMSAADSSNLIDSPVANQLGYHRALFYSDEQGILEKFRPYAPVEQEWLHHVQDLLKKRSTR